ncbi:MAG: helix-turn-helix transcriptional regulator [Chloroflexia bacterium]|nr:helix-turn-helix transcriptional regulator [Chloroflexia bacterium]
MDTIGTRVAFCPRFHKAIEQIGSRWTGVIIRALANDVRRFGDLKHSIPGLSDRMLADRLKELQVDGIVERTVIPETPVRVEYRLTDKGCSLADVMAAITIWAETWVELDEPDAEVELCIE